MLKGNPEKDHRGGLIFVSGTPNSGVPHTPGTTPNICHPKICSATLAVCGVPEQTQRIIMRREKKNRHAPSRRSYYPLQLLFVVSAQARRLNTCLGI
jgi:hypothetical protein